METRKLQFFYKIDQKDAFQEDNMLFKGLYDAQGVYMIFRRVNMRLYAVQ